MGGLTPDGELDRRFRGWCPHRNRAVTDLALVTGMRLQEWSTVLLPELGIGSGSSGSSIDFELGACAKRERPRVVYVTADARASVETFCMLERPEMVDAAQESLRARRAELFLVREVDYERGRVRGVLDGQEVIDVIKAMRPGLRAIAVRDTDGYLDPLAVFIGRGGRMLSPSGWDRVRWRAWDRMKAWAGERDAALMPRQRWLYHDLRHTFALQLLIYLTRMMLSDEVKQQLPMATLVEHMAFNPILAVQERLGHASPSTTYRYIRYLRNPVRDVEQAFREWTASAGASYAEIGRKHFGLEAASAAQG
jgi:integrase